MERFPGASNERQPLLDDEQRDYVPDHSQGWASGHLARLRHGFHHRKHNRVEKALFGGILLLFLLACLGFGLFAAELFKYGRERRRHHPPGSAPGEPGWTSAPWPGPTKTGSWPTSAPTARPPAGGKNNEMCLTPECVHVATSLIDSIDFSADPCNDFYAFSTGGWRAKHPIPESRGLYGVGQWLSDRNSKILLDVLTSKSHINDPVDHENLKILQHFFNSCVDEQQLDDLDSEPLAIMSRHIVRLWRGDHDWHDDRRTGAQNIISSPSKSDSYPRDLSLTGTLAYLHSHAIPALFENNLDGDVVHDPGLMRIWLSQDGLGLAKDYYHDEDTLRIYRDVIQRTIHNIYELIGHTYDSHHSTQLAEDVVGFEKRLADISLNPEDLDNPSTTYHLLTIDELQELFPVIDWNDYFASFSPRPSFPDPLIVKSTRYMHDLLNLLHTEDKATMEAYFLWHAASEVAPLLGPSQPAHRAVKELTNYLKGVEPDATRVRSEECLDSMLDNFGILAGKYFIERTFGGDSKEYAEDVIYAVIQAFKDRLQELDWIDHESKLAAKGKAEAVHVKIGYPSSPDTLSPEALHRYYSLNLPITTDDYFGNVIRSRTADVKRMYNKVGKRRDYGEWEMIPSEVNAYYNPSSNEIAFPAGILQAPYFSHKWPEYLAFGAFGSVAGHELTHAFDSAGRLYDKDGRLTDWWTPSTVANFENLKACILNQYGNFTITDPRGRKLHINSKLTLGEDIADGGGAAQAFRAWKDRFESDVNGEQFGNWLLPGLNFTRDQLFWLSYGRSWARNIKPSEAMNRIYTDPHSPTSYRVIGVAQNDPNFQEAWGCHAGDRMNRPRDQMCSIW